MTSSRLVMAGVDLRTVQELLGHKRQAMTLRYALSPEHQQLEAGYSGWPARQLPPLQPPRSRQRRPSEAGGGVVKLPSERTEW